MILTLPVAALPCCALCGWRTPADGIEDSGKGGCRRFHGFRRFRVSGPGGCWSLPLPNVENLAHPKVSIVRTLAWVVATEPIADGGLRTHPIADGGLRIGRNPARI